MRILRELGGCNGWLETKPYLFSVNANVCLIFVFFIPLQKNIARDRENLGLNTVCSPHLHRIFPSDEGTNTGIERP